MLIKRNQLSSDQQTLLSALICKKLVSSSHFINAKTIAFYMPFKGEISPLEAMGVALQQKKKCYLPVIDTNSERTIIFAEVDGNSTWHTNKFGILEPEVINDQVIDPNDLDLVIMPLLAFDKGNYRLGFGGGYYDKAFENATHPYLLGLAYEWQMVESLPHESHDIQLGQVLLSN